jgi:hypothetical protein
MINGIYFNQEIPINPKRRHLTLKTFLENFDRLIIDQDFDLLRELYGMEYDLWNVELH